MPTALSTNGIPHAVPLFSRERRSCCLPPIHPPLPDSIFIRRPGSCRHRHPGHSRRHGQSDRAQQAAAPASVSVITREQLDKMSVTTVNDAIRSLPGVNINPATGLWSTANEIKIRGLDSDYTLLLINGQRINSRDALTSSYGNDFDLAAAVSGGGGAHRR